jgi:hypothetical protein
VLILIPAILILPRFFGLAGIYYAGPVADLVSAAIAGIWLGLELRQLPGGAGRMGEPAEGLEAEQLAPVGSPREQFAE